MRWKILEWTADTGWVPPLEAVEVTPSLLLAFGTREGPDVVGPLAELSARFPMATALGCSTAGEIVADRVLDGSIVVAAIEMPDTDLRAASEDLCPETDAFAAGERLARRLVDGRGPHPAGILVFSDGLHVNGSALVAGFRAALPEDVPVSGGLAGDGARFQETWVWDGGAPKPHRVAAVALGGAVRVRTGSRGGWDPFGPERRVTRSEGNVLFELDGRPALDLYKEYLGELAAGLPATALLFPLSVRAAGDEHPAVVRTVLSVDEAAQSMTFAGDVPPGCLARLMRANKERLVAGAHDAAEVALSGGRGPVLAIAISCVGRRLVLKHRVDEELEATLHALPLGSSQIGFYSYGEISPTGYTACDVHNQTMTLTLLGPPDA